MDAEGEGHSGERHPPNPVLLLVGGLLLLAAALAIVAVLFAAWTPRYAGTATGLLVSGGSSQLCVEPAITPEEREIGLSGRTQLGDFDGMAFLFTDTALSIASNPPDEATAAAPALTSAPFWMKETLIPLDIIFVGGDGRVVDIRTMEPCVSDPCPVFEPAGRYLYAVELPKGWAREFDIRPGVRLRLTPGCIPFDRD